MRRHDTSPTHLDLGSGWNTRPEEWESDIERRFLEEVMGQTVKFLYPKFGFTGEIEDFFTIGFSSRLEK